MRSIALTASAASLIATQSTYSSVASISARNSPLNTGRSRPLVDEAICGDRNDEHVAKFAGGLQVTNMAQVEEIECSVRLYDDLTGAAALFTDRSDFRHGPDLVPRAYRAVDARLADQLCDA